MKKKIKGLLGSLILLVLYPVIGYSQETEYMTGAIPDPTPVIEQPDISQVKKRSALPEKFDPRNGGDTAVKSQGGRGLCWDFSATATIETALLKKEGVAADFSELYVDYLFANNATGIPFENPLSYGRYLGHGEQEYVPIYGAIRWNNPVPEEVMPYVPYDEVPFISLDQLKEHPSVHVQGMIALPRLAKDYTEEERDAKVTKIKEQVMTKSGLTYQWASGYHQSLQSDFYNHHTSAFFVPQRENNNGIDHSCVIVGWDDAYSKANFVTKPKRDGAFIVRNSWSTLWGDQGYYYVSYEDYYIATSQMYGITQIEPSDNHDKQYSHTEFYNFYPDEFKQAEGYPGTYTIANTYETENTKEMLKAISFHTTQYETSYQVYIDPTGTQVGHTISNLNNLPKVAEGVRTNPGIETVSLENPIEVGAAGKFSVIVRLTRPAEVSSTYILMEKGWLNQHAEVNAGESFVSFQQNPQQMSYYDTAELYGGNVYINAFTDDVIAVSQLKICPEKMTLAEGDINSFKATVLPENATNQKVIWESGNPEIATVNNEGKVKGKTVGTATITATTEDGSKKSTATVTVIKSKPANSITILNKQKRNIVYLNKVKQLETRIEPQDTTQKELVFESLDPNIAEVNQKGEVIGKSFGETTIKVYVKANPAIYDELPIITDDHGDTADTATEVKMGELMKGTYDHKFNTSSPQTASKGDIDFFKFTAPEKGTYVLHGSAIKPDGLQDGFEFQVWLNNSSVIGTTKWAFSDFSEFQLEKEDVLTWKVVGNRQTAPGMPSIVFLDTTVGTNYNFFIDKKDQIKFGEIYLNNTLGLDANQLSQNVKVNDQIQFTSEVVDYQNIFDSFYGRVIWSSSNTNVAEVGYETGLVTIKGKGQVTITAKNSFGVFVPYSTLNKKITFEVK